jgi:cellulose synthase (UDP-forming)
LPARSPLPPETLPRREPATENASVQSPTILVFVVAAMVGVLAYTIFLFDPSNRGHWLPYSLVVTAELVLIAQALLSMWTILSGGQDPRDFAFHAAREAMYDQVEIAAAGLRRMPSRWPLRLDGRATSIDVFITVYGEDLAVIERTVRAAVAMRGAHLTWVLDDGRSDEVRDLAARLGARYIRRLSSNGAKAGNVNHALTLSKAEYFAIFDADFVPDERFLEETLPFFTATDVAFVQTPQAYGNMRNLISRGAGYMQAVFYRFVQPGRNKFNAAFCVGTNVVFRRRAIDSIGGMYTDSKSEDVWTSLLLHEQGWRSIYIPVTLAVGNAPETIEDYTKQQMRWATGGFEILLSRNPLSRKVTLTPDQRIQYLVTASHYLVGIVPLLLLLVPPLEIFFDLRPVNLSVDGWTWFAFYFGFYGLQILLAFHTMGSFRLETLLLASVSFPIYVRALVNVLEGRQQKWHVTGGTRARRSPFNFMIPQLLTFAFLAVTSAVGIYKDAGNQVVTLATAWNVTNMLILGVFIASAFGELATARRAEAVAAVPATDVLTAPIELDPTRGGPAADLPSRRPIPVFAGASDTQERSA